jgi:hypothetical protein
VQRNGSRVVGACTIAALPSGVSVVLLGGASTGCSSDIRASCTEMHAELASLPSPTLQAWNDINEVDEATERIEGLQSDFATHCA